MKLFFKKRKQKKYIKELLKAAKHARNMREDVVNQSHLAELLEAEKNLKSIIKININNSDQLSKTKDKDLEKSIIRLERATDKVYPFKLRKGIREQTEIIIVAVAVAMTIRAFFLEPFKIPTGSMQPTLNGITVEAQSSPGFFDNPITKLPKWLLTGTSYKEIRASTSGKGYWEGIIERNSYVLKINNIKHYIPIYMRELINFNEKKYYKKGDTIISAKVITGDQIIVNKMKYNFSSPLRGHIPVFDTRSLPKESGVRPNTFYIKRLVGLPNETIQIQDKKLLANQQVITEPEIFRIISSSEEYNKGYGNAGELSVSSDSIILGDDEYLMLGDNTKPRMSLDGRFFGGVPREDIRGPASFVYWPFREHWGFIR